MFPYEAACGGRIEATGEISQPIGSFDQAVILQEQKAVIPGKLSPGVVPGPKVVARVLPDENVSKEVQELGRGGIVRPVGAEEDVECRTGGVTGERFA